MSLDVDIPVLVVDDYKSMFRIIRKLLERLGFHDIDYAVDGREALERLRGRKYELVISDWNMSPMTGYELLQAVRSDKRLSHIPFIMVTAETKIENVVAAMKAGVDDYIIKPFTAETLQKKIENVMQSAVVEV